VARSIRFSAASTSDSTSWARGELPHRAIVIEIIDRRISGIEPIIFHGLGGFLQPFAAIPDQPVAESTNVR